MQRHIKFIMMTSTNTLLVLVGLVSLYLLASCNAAALKGLQKSGAGQKWKNCSESALAQVFNIQKLLVRCLMTAFSDLSVQATLFILSRQRAQVPMSNIIATS